MLVSKSIALTKKENLISETGVQSQLQMAPGPNEKTKSGYPHRYKDLGGLIPRRTDRTESMDSTATCTTTSSYREYPVYQNGSYDFNAKPKMNTGPHRGITNQNGNYRGTICHDGKGTDANVGNFHLCEKEKEKKDAYSREYGESAYQRRH